MIHPTTEVRATAVDGKGLGLFATERLPRGTIVWVRDRLDRLFALEEVERLPVALRGKFRDFTFRDPSGAALLHWDSALFVNHSCEANLMWLVDSWIEIATREVARDEELTEDYGALNLPGDERARCACGAATCRGEYSSDVTPELRSVWAEAVRSASRDVSGVEQPLLDLLGPGDRARVAERLAAARLDHDTRAL